METWLRRRKGCCRCLRNTSGPGSVGSNQPRSSTRRPSLTMIYSSIPAMVVAASTWPVTCYRRPSAVLPPFCSAAAVLLSMFRESCEGTGTIQHYFLGGAYCVLGNLWDITDKDIDIFAEQLLSLWLKAEPGSCLQDFISAARETCKLPYLVGSAPVWGCQSNTSEAGWM